MASEQRYKVKKLRDVRLFAKPMLLTLGNCKLVAILNKHYIHTSTLRLVFAYDPGDAEKLQQLSSQFLVEATPGRKRVTEKKITVNAGRYWDAKWDSYLQNGALPSVQQKQQPRLHCGQENLTVGIAVTGNDSKGLIMRLVDVVGEQGQQYLDTGE